MLRKRSQLIDYISWAEINPSLNPTVNSNNKNVFFFKESSEQQDVRDRLCKLNLQYTSDSINDSNVFHLVTLL